MSRTRLKLPKIEPTPESVYVNRRSLLKQAGVGVMGMAAGALLADHAAAQRVPSLPEAAYRPGVERAAVLARFPAARNAKYVLPVEAPLTPREYPFSYNNFYEFTTEKELVWVMARNFEVDPWTVEVVGECHKPRKFDIDDLFRFELEERTYRFRCVEAWAMDVPWTGFPLSKLLEAVEPKASANYVRFISVHRPRELPGQSRDPNTRHYPWPYFEGLRMDEAMNELTLGCVGLYGKPLTRQNGAPFRIIVPWKYGYKSAKSIVRIELVEPKPTTLWETLQPLEYPFESNVDPTVPHPRWSQAQERVLATFDYRPTLPYNGYGQYVAQLYAKP